MEVELGSGDGSFLVEYASHHPNRNFIGVERLLGRLRKLDRKGQQSGLTNLRGVRIESSYFLKYLLPPHSVATIHVYFPDPWPKRKHRRHRLVNEELLQIIYRVLEPEGTVYLRTDDLDYFEQMVRVFAGNPLFVNVQPPEALRNLVTDFEREFKARGICTLGAAYQVAAKGVPVNLDVDKRPSAV